MKKLLNSGGLKIIGVFAIWLVPFIMIMILTGYVWGVDEPNVTAPNYAHIGIDFSIVTDIDVGGVTINTETGEVTIPDDMSLNEAAKSFWDAVERQFRNEAKRALRLQLWREIQAETWG